MPIQFKTRTLLYLTAAAGCWITSVKIASSVHEVNWQDAIAFTTVTSPVWLPALVVAYALGSRKFTAWTLAAFIAASPLGLGVTYLAGWIFAD